jgi:integrase
VKYSTAKEINELVESIRLGHPPQGKDDERYYDPQMPGLHIRLLKTGRAAWKVRFKSLGRSYNIKIGDVRTVDRAQAIKKAKELRNKTELGDLDPNKARRERMNANKVKFITCVPSFIEAKKLHDNIRDPTAGIWESLLTKSAFKTVHNLPLDEITRAQLQICINDVARKRGKIAARSCWAAMHVFFEWAIGNQLPDDHHNPMAKVKRPPRNPSRSRVLTDDEIRLIWSTCEKRKIATTNHGRELANPDIFVAIQLLLLTGCRAQEIGDLTRSEVKLDDAKLLLPASRTKQKRDHHVPLVDSAVQILRAAEQRRSERRPDDKHLFGPVQLFRRAVRPDARNREGGLNLSGANYRIDHYIAMAGGTPPPDWTLHDTRRTVRTRLAKLGVIRDVAEVLLGHRGQRDEMDDTYNVYDYWDERRQAMVKWEDHLIAIINSTAEKIAHSRFAERGTGGDDA